MEDSKLTTPDSTIYNWRIETTTTQDDHFQQNFDATEEGALSVYDLFIKQTKRHSDVKLYKRGYTPWEQTK